LRARRTAVLVGVCAGPLVIAAAAHAGAWDFQPHVNADLIYTDNIELVPSAIARDESVLAVSPGFKLTGKGPRLDADVEYELQSYTYAHVSDRNGVFNLLDATANLTVVPENFFLGANAAISQAIIDPRGTIPLSNVTESNNRTDVTSWSIHPYYDHKFGSDLEARVGYAYSRLHYAEPVFDGTPLQDLNYQTVSASIGQESERHPFGWAIIFDRYDAGYQTATDFAYQVAAAKFSFALSPTFGLIARGGQESDVTLSQSAAKLDSSFWAAGFSWRPSLQHELNATIGNRFFGNTYSLFYRFAGRRLTAGARYDEGPTTQGVDSLNRPVFSGTPDQVGASFTPITAEVYLSKQGRAWFELTGRRNTIELEGYADRREYIPSTDHESEKGVSGVWSHLLGPRTRLQLAAKWVTIAFRASVRDDYMTTYSVGLNRQIGRHMSLHGTVQRWRRTTDDTSPEVAFLFYTENAVKVGMRYQF
jgi:hypothetical protein